MSVPASSTADHFIPGIGVDRSTSGGSTRVGLTYGASWSAATQLAGPMTLSWLANTSQGRMVGDYISTSIRNGGNAVPTIAVATAPSGGTFNEAMYVPTGGLQITGGARRAVTGPVLAPSGAGRLAAPHPGRRAPPADPLH